MKHLSTFLIGSILFTSNLALAFDIKCHKPELFKQMYYTDIKDPVMLNYERGIRDRAEREQRAVEAGTTSNDYYPPFYQQQIKKELTKFALET